MSQIPQRDSSIEARAQSSMASDALNRVLRELIAAPTHEAQAWAHAAVAALSRLTSVTRLGANITLELIEPDSGRCQAIATTHLSPLLTGQAGVIPGERTMLELIGSRRGSAIRLIVHGAPAADAPMFLPDEIKSAALAAVELFEAHIWVVIKRRRDIRKRLTEAQNRILEFLIADLSEREIGERVGRSPHTIHDHVKGIYAALDIKSRGELLVLWHGGAALAPGANLGTAGLSGPAGLPGLAGGTPNVPTAHAPNIVITPVNGSASPLPATSGAQTPRAKRDDRHG